MSKVMKFIFPMPPSINATYRGAGHGGRLIYTDEADAYMTEQGLLLNFNDYEPLQGPCVVFMVVYMKYPNKGDMHNNHKLILDLLEGRAYVNDSQVVVMHIYRKHDSKNPRVEVEIEPYNLTSSD